MQALGSFSEERHHLKYNVVGSHTQRITSSWKINASQHHNWQRALQKKPAINRKRQRRTSVSVVDTASASGKLTSPVHQFRIRVETYESWKKLSSPLKIDRAQKVTYCQPFYLPSTRHHIVQRMHLMCRRLFLTSVCRCSTVHRAPNSKEARTNFYFFLFLNDYKFCRLESFENCVFMFTWISNFSAILFSVQIYTY